MTSPRFTHLLTFLLPNGARRIVTPVDGWPYGCLVEFGRTSLVSIMGPSREATFDAAAQILADGCAGLAENSITARVYQFPKKEPTDGRDWLRVSSDCGITDGWTIIIGARVAFSPTGIDPYFPRIQTEARPALKAIER